MSSEKVSTSKTVQDLSDWLSIKIDPTLLQFFDVVYLSGKQVPGTELKTGHYPADSFSDKEKLHEKIDKIGKGLTYWINHAIKHSIITGENYSPNKTNCLNYEEYTSKQFAKKKPESFDVVALGDIKDMLWGERRNVLFAHVEKGKKLGKIYFSPANRFDTVGTEAKCGYAFSYEVDHGFELICETNFLVVVENPEYVYKGE